MNIAYGRLIVVAIGAFVAGAAPEFDASWKAQGIPDTATFGYVMKVLTVASIEGLRGGLPSAISAIVAFFVHQDASNPFFALKNISNQNKQNVSVLARSESIVKETEEF
jgi:hypothetical protein